LTPNDIKVIMMSACILVEQRKDKVECI